MTEAPFISTLIAIGLIPVAFLFIHAYLSGVRKWKYHNLTGLIAIVWDLSLSIGYMLYRTFGGEIEGSSLEITGLLLIYFIVHGLVAIIVIILELSVLTTGFIQWRNKKKIDWHRKLSKILFILWWFAFLTGEIFYIVSYLI
jgi:uncharacterized membrane protein YozB (DUF420 family)